MRLECKYEVQAAHQLSAGVPPGHPCRRLHGHRYNITVTIIGDVNPETGMIMEYEEIDERVWEVLELVDHLNLNDVGLQMIDNGLKVTSVLHPPSVLRRPELAELVRKNSTVENFATWLKAELAARFPHVNQKVGVLSVLAPQVYAVRIEEDADHTVEL